MTVLGGAELLATIQRQGASYVVTGFDFVEAASETSMESALGLIATEWQNAREWLERELGVP